MATRKPALPNNKKRAPPRRRKAASAGAAADRAAAAAAPGAVFPIVALGASAGGLEAFEQFFRSLPARTGMGFVLVQHLDPSHASMLVEILQRTTPMPVVEATEQMHVEPDRVHIIPPNREMVIFNGALQLRLPSEPRGVRMPIDAFFRSLADDRGEAAVGIVLSGTGTDGTLGLRAIFGAGGLCLVQEPSGARYDGMPSSAIQAGYVNQVLAVADMPKALLGGTRALPIRAAAEAAAPAAAGSGLTKILQQLRSSTGHDFSLYKKSTIGRRIERRMALHGIDDAQAYARYAREHPAESQALFRELLINVTSFFRDPQAFVVMREDIVPALLAAKPDGATVRIWVAGCATGEEVYSVAIVLRECIDAAQRELKVQIYGTDLDDEAVKVARAGLYPPNVAQDIAPERLRRFFVKEEAGYRIRKEIREMAVFATQSVIRDPPFTRIDLLCCRNLLIYLEPELQNRLIPAFHYALNPGGVLLLSPSESIGSHTELFEPIDRKWKFYRARAGAASARSALGSRLAWVAGSAGAAMTPAGEPPSERHIADLAKRALLQSFAPAAVVTDLQGNVLYVHGDTGRWLRPAPGHPSHNVVEMARDGLQSQLRQALQRAADQGQPSLDLPVTLLGDDDGRSLRLSVRPLPDPGAAQGLLLVSVQDGAVAPPARSARAARAAPGSKVTAKAEAEADLRVALERELVHAKDSLRAMLEEQQAFNEELKSTNEELQSTNEELQSTNEELETSKEELQSVNEELVTVNSELQTKIEQMSSMQDDMKNLLDNLRLGTIFLDRDLHIRRFTRDATRVFRLVAGDIGRPLADIRSELPDCDLIADAQVVLDTLVPIEREARSADGAWYLARIQPYRTVDNVIDGVVLTFADVTERVNAIATHKARLLAEAIVDAVAHPLLVLDAGLRVIGSNVAFHRQFGGDAESTVGQRLFDLGAGRWDLAPVHELLEAPWPAQPGLEHRAIELGTGAARIKLDVRRIASQAGRGELVLLLIEPIATAA